MKYLSMCVLTYLLVSCATTKKVSDDFYYEINPEMGYHLYNNKECVGETIAFIPANVSVYTKYPGKKSKVYVSYGSRSGYARTLRYTNAKNAGFRILPLSVIAYQDSMLAVYNSSRISSPFNTSSQNTSSHYQSTSGGSVNVSGYYRKDGTYVRPHTRKAPSRKH